MTHPTIRGAAAALLATAALAAQAQQKPVDIGFIGTLSTPAGYIGEDERDAFMLAVKEGGGKLGGVPVNVRVEDDALKPANAKQIADKMVQGGVRLFTGVNFSNVLAAVAPTVLNAGGFYVSLNAGPSNYAGKACNANYFSVSFQNDSYADTAGMAANELGAKRVVVMAPNYQAGRDAVAGFKRTYKGEIAEEIYTKLDQADFSVELARVRSLAPDAIFQFHPGGAGINLTKQFANSGLDGKIKMITPIYSMDERMLAATGTAGKGFYLSSLWSADLDNPQNKHFVQAFTQAYNRAPTAYAGLRHRQPDRHGPEGRGRRHCRQARRLPRRPAPRRLPQRARQVQVRPQPASRAGLVSAAHRGRPRRQAGLQEPQGDCARPHRRARGRLQDVIRTRVRVCDQPARTPRHGTNAGSGLSMLGVARRSPVRPANRTRQSKHHHTDPHARRPSRFLETPARAEKAHCPAL